MAEIPGQSSTPPVAQSAPGAEAPAAREQPQQINEEAPESKPFTMNNNTLSGSDSTSQPVPLAPAAATTTTASTTPQAATPSRDLGPSTAQQQQPESRDVIMGGYETRGNIRGNGAAANANNVGGANITPQPRPGGAPARIYMNENIVPHLLDGMKLVVKDQPSNPLRALGEYLIQKSNEVGETSSEQTAS